MSQQTKNSKMRTKTAERDEQGNCTSGKAKTKLYHYRTNRQRGTEQTWLEMELLMWTKRPEVIRTKADEKHKEIKTIRKKVIDVEDRGYWCLWS